MIKPRVLVFSGYGLNSEEELVYAFELAGAKADIIHINNLIDGHCSLKNYQILGLPGGFAYGDDTGAGNAYANRLKNHLWEQLMKFIDSDQLIIGVCNGFQILANLGIFPVRFALLPNSTTRYINRWVDLKVENKTPWLAGITSFYAPIAHGEGRLYTSKALLEKLKNKKLVVLRYFKGEIYNFQNLPPNPTGTLDDIAGITDETGRIFGLMPHPERGMFFTHLPQWTLLKEKYIREKKPLPKFAPAFKIFQNAVNYFS